MKVIAKRARLADVTSLVGQAVASKSTKRVLECLKLVGKDGRLEVAGTDLEVAVRYRLEEDLEVQEEGEAVVPAALLVNLLREVGDERITVRAEQQKLALETDGGFFELECVDPAEYPAIPEFPAEAAWQVQAEDLRSLVEKTTFAAGKEASRFVLNGVRVLVADGVLRFVATDGRRLATLARPVQGGTGNGGRTASAIVGVKGLGHCERLAAEESGRVLFAVEDRFVAMRTNRAEVVARVMEGSFPDHEQIIPRDCPREAKLPVGVLSSKLRQARQFASLETQAVALRFRPGELTVAAQGAEGRAEVKLGIDYEGAEERVGFNPGFLLDVLKVVEGEQVSFGFRSANTAAKLSDDGGLVYVVMPMLLE